MGASCPKIICICQWNLDVSFAHFPLDLEVDYLGCYLMFSVGQVESIKLKNIINYGSNNFQIWQLELLLTLSSVADFSKISRSRWTFSTYTERFSLSAFCSEKRVIFALASINYKDNNQIKFYINFAVKKFEFEITCFSNNLVLSYKSSATGSAHFVTILFSKRNFATSPISGCLRRARKTLAAS